MAINIGNANISKIRFAEQGANPSTPASGFGFLFVKSDGVYYKDDAGNVTGPFGASGAGLDTTAIHDNVASEISAITEKVTPVFADLLLIEDSAASNAKKRVQIGNLPGGSGALTHTYLGYNTIGGSVVAATQYRTYLKKITLASDGFLGSIGVYCKANTNGATPNLECAVWNDNAGDPQYVIAFGGNGRSASGNVLLEGAATAKDPRWLHINIGVWLTAGDYWIGFGVTAAVIDLYYDGSGSDRHFTPIDLYMTDYGNTNYGITAPTTTTDRFSVRASILS